MSFERWMNFDFLIMKGGKKMENSKYVIFDILGVKKNGFKNSFSFDKDAECIINEDSFISKIVMSSDISKATFYLHDSLEISENNILKIIDHISSYLGNIMISLLKNSFNYSSVLLKPTIRISAIHLLVDDQIKLNEHIQIRDSAICHSVFSNGNEILKQWIEDVDISNYISKNDKYDILFLLLQGGNIVQKYMAMYAYLMCLVKEIYSSQKESQKQVVKYISNNCSRVGIKLVLSLCTRQGAKPNEKEDQFTALRNKIAHPANINDNVDMSENAINQLASIICCAIEDISL
ncbi:MAG: hypothetical protein HXM41_07800 [Lachnospiraceae bacterium]|nr:hypothetical protein [Lachnospiraceae bacterium]